jgi:hypothetical protein
MRPNLEIHASDMRFSPERLQRIQQIRGVVQVEGMDAGGDGTFGAIRITFESYEIMDGYLFAIGRP